jgi:hypothetical protein
VEGGRGRRAQLQKCEGGDRLRLGEDREREGERVPGVPVIPAAFWVDVESSMELGEEPLGEQFGQVVALLSADPSEEQAADIDEAALDDGDAPLREEPPCDGAQAWIVPCCTSVNTQDGDGGLVLIDHSGEVVLDDPLAIGSGPGSSERQRSEARSSRRISGFSRGCWNRRDAEAINHNRTSEARGENKTKNAATKSTARQQVLASHGRV